MSAAEQMIHRLLADLEEAGFGYPDEEVEGADLVDLMSDWYDSLKAFTKGSPNV